MANITIMRTYAMVPDPTMVPDMFRICHTDTSVTVSDLYPKSIYHYLVIPRLPPTLKPEQMQDLRALLCLPREQARGILVRLREDALATVKLIEGEMMRQYGFTWPCHMGFHAIPTLEYVPVPLKHLKHLHLHVISSDFTGQYYKEKKHVNSFHPRLGFFLPIDEVIRWFDPDIAPTWFAMKAAIDKDEYMALLKTDPLCPHCDEQFRSVAKLTRHVNYVFRQKKEEHRKRQEESRTMLAVLEAAAAAERSAEESNGAGPSEAASGSNANAAGAEAPAAQDAPQNVAAASTETELASDASVGEPAVEVAEGSGVQSVEDAGAGASAPVEVGQKRKHSETQDDTPEVLDANALPDPSPAKRHQLDNTASSS
ncbi:hypothetical protein C8Q70DRAFT_39923 [Cubamyces menziesii]|uniref:Uncharacterized protein n=1 Tax=Trametes cubensis TaxID=1111947 RepID=A0AAD7XCL3_9APHY|nr:hypothetical protein C8Q70DRAFT_39923 [Cubamyces menziesii]KAJ8487879.1 hypothetical protein ONZ51_g3897 [Trametes cubensis]